jgi:large subunit ribosomal protein L21
MYAIVKVGGKQYRVEKGDSLVVDRMREDEGAKVALEPLLYRSDKDAVFERKALEKVKVEAVVTGHERGKKVHVLKFKPKRGYKRRTGHRSDLTRLEVKEIKLLSRKPAASKPAARGGGKPVAKKAAGAKKATGAKRTTTRKTTGGSKRAAAKGAADGS